MNPIKGWKLGTYPVAFFKIEITLVYFSKCELKTTKKNKNIQTREERVRQVNFHAVLAYKIRKFGALLGWVHIYLIFSFDPIACQP